MGQVTLVLKLSAEEQERLRSRMASGIFEYRVTPYARFSARGEGVIVTLYDSGKLVIQGDDPAAFARKYLDRAEEPADKAGLPEAGARVLVGSDEAGKGDYFGPLVVAAVRVDPAQRKEIHATGTIDSKKLSEERVRRLAPALQGRYEHALEILDPSAYNAEYGRFGNLNPLLAELHARAIKRLARPGDVVLVDRFGDERLISRRLEGLEVELHQTPRAEREPAVAAASVIARLAFLEHLKALSEESAVDLPKGAGIQVDEAARRYIQIHGFQAIGKVAKIHFKNTERLRHA
jgi:ribonuclease HIII